MHKNSSKLDLEIEQEGLQYETKEDYFLPTQETYKVI